MLLPIISAVLQLVDHLQSFDQTIGQFYGHVGAVDLVLKAEFL